MSPKTHGIKHSYTLQQQSFGVTGLEKMQEDDYADEPEFILVSQEGRSKELHELLTWSKNHEETLHSRFKSWNILESQSHHGHGTDKRIELHGHIMIATSVITQYNFEQNPPFQVH